MTPEQLLQWMNSNGYLIGRRRAGDDSGKHYYTEISAEEALKILKKMNRTGGTQIGNFNHQINTYR